MNFRKTLLIWLGIIVALLVALLFLIQSRRSGVP